jgi:F-type H+-transporting ATPase subunit epsilon
MAEGQIQLQIITPEGVQLSEAVSEVTAPSVDGQFGVLPGHRPMLAALATGIISYVQGAVTHEIAVGAGYVEIHNDQAVVITQRYSTKAAVDPVRVRLDLKEADAALDDYAGELGSAEHVELVEKELWAAALLELYGDPPPPTMRVYGLPPVAEDYVQTAAPPDEANTSADPASKA